MKSNIKTFELPEDYKCSGYFVMMSSNDYTYEAKDAPHYQEPLTPESTGIDFSYEHTNPEELNLASLGVFKNKEEAVAFANLFDNLKMLNLNKYDVVRDDFHIEIAVWACSEAIGSEDSYEVVYQHSLYKKDEAK